MRRLNLARRPARWSKLYTGMDLFCGTGSMRRVMSRKMKRVFSVDIKETRRGSNAQHFYCGDVCSPEFAGVLRTLKPNFLWASLPCEYFSHAWTVGEVAQNGRVVLRSVLRLIKYYARTVRPFVCVLENPRDRLREELNGMLHGFVIKEASHCMYSATLKCRKNVDLYVLARHAEYFSFKKCCGENCPHAYFNETTGRYNHPQSAQAGRQSDGTPGVARYDDRIALPPSLCGSVVYQARKALEAERRL